ncbi:MAG: hypothetical protein JNL01_02405 [Bdellovibrionales bacterium]|nr:hypothetical protein [Bdellovibrionales bacterium]
MKNLFFAVTWFAVSFSSFNSFSFAQEADEPTKPILTNLKDPNTMSNAELNAEVQAMQKIQKKQKKIGKRKDERADKLLTNNRPVNARYRKRDFNRTLRGGKRMTESNNAYQMNNEAFDQEMKARKVLREREAAGAGATR